MNVVIDANVIATANFRADHASTECIRKCILWLSSVKDQSDCISVDSHGLIFKEYAHYAHHKGQPGVGDAFFKWLFDHQGYPEVCEMVSITEHPHRVFEEFPEDPLLAKFDMADRKYVAVVIASQFHPTIYNAVDSDWSNHKQPLLSHNIIVNELC